MIYTYKIVDDSRAKEQEMCPGPNSDMIINLPDNVIDQILVRLPILDAVRTSVLSTNWRYKWTTITQLVFHDNQLVQLPSPNNKDKLTNFIDQVLLLHSGFILKFELSCLPISSSMIDAWILFLSRRNIKQFLLKFSHALGQEHYKLPTCFYSAQQISTLELERCVLKPPPTFTGFSYLKSLYLSVTTFVDKGGFECLISKCPVLERLTLILVYCIDNLIDNLNICSPNLKYLYLYHPCDDICFENTPLLSDVSIYTSTIDVVKVLRSLPNLRKFMLKFNWVNKIPEKLPFTCHHLDNLTLLLFNFKDVNHICVTLCLLNSSPNLRELEIRSYPFSNSSEDIENFWEKRTHIDWKMSRLQVVKIRNFNGIEFKSGLEFIKLLLANLPMLEMLSIRYSEQDILDRDRLKLLKELLIFPRASPNAKIKLSEHHEK